MRKYCKAILNYTHQTYLDRQSIYILYIWTNASGYQAYSLCARHSIFRRIIIFEVTIALLRKEIKRWRKKSSSGIETFRNETEGGWRMEKIVKKTQRRRKNGWRQSKKIWKYAQSAKHEHNYNVCTGWAESFALR